jgi:hypothetical protein
MEAVPAPEVILPPEGKVQLKVQEGSAGTLNEAAALPQRPFIVPVMFPGSFGTARVMILFNAVPVVQGFDTETDIVPPVNTPLKAT